MPRATGPVNAEVVPTGLSLPTLEELSTQAHVVRLPMRVTFRGVRAREVMLLRGPLGWAEFGPFPEYPDAEAAAWLLAAIEAGWWGWPAPQRKWVGVNATIPAVAPEQVEDILCRFEGCTTVKIKVAQAGQELADDVARVAEVRALLGAGATIRVDANGAWSSAQAEQAILALEQYGLEYVEQPCATVEELAQLRRRLAERGHPVPIAADESIRRASDPLRVAQLHAADVIVVKAAPLGGVRAASRIVEQAGLPAVVSSALDSSVGIAAGVALACALPGLGRACGLGTVTFFTQDVSPTPLLPRGGRLQRADAERLVASELDLTELGVEPARRAWWFDRLARCHALLP